MSHRPLASLLSAALLVGCATEPSGPPTVQWGSDECSHCRMIVGEPRFAAVARSASGEEARFDDLGCLASFLAESAAEASWTAWVHDSASDRWLEAPQAWFTASGHATPMGSGLRAFATREAAAAASSSPFDWAALQARPTAAPPIASQPGG